MRQIGRLFGDEPLRQAHPLPDCLGEKQGKPSIELRPQVPTQHFLSRIPSQLVAFPWRQSNSLGIPFRWGRMYR
jgi:hypothetical protein